MKFGWKVLVCEDCYACIGVLNVNWGLMRIREAGGYWGSYGLFFSNSLHHDSEVICCGQAVDSRMWIHGPTEITGELMAWNKHDSSYEFDKLELSHTWRYVPATTSREKRQRWNSDPFHRDAKQWNGNLEYQGLDWQRRIVIYTPQEWQGQDHRKQRIETI